VILVYKIKTINLTKKRLNTRKKKGLRKLIFKKMKNLEKYFFGKIFKKRGFFVFCTYNKKRPKKYIQIFSLIDLIVVKQFESYHPFFVKLQ
jgi:hypothetical protein